LALRRETLPSLRASQFFIQFFSPGPQGLRQLSFQSLHHTEVTFARFVTEAFAIEESVLFAHYYFSGGHFMIPGGLLGANAAHLIHPVAAALPFARTRNSLSGITNSALPQLKQTNSFGKAQTVGFSRPIRPGKWMATSAVNLSCLSDPHVLHDTVRSLSEPIIAKPVISPLQAGKVRHRAVDDWATS
jgi:hypothetical protein